MIALDTNILVYSHRADSEWSQQAYACVARAARGVWAIPWPCIHEFFAIVTHPRIYDPPSAPGQAIDQIEAWMESPGLALLAEGGAHWETLRALVELGKVTGARVHDARIAALCLHHGVQELWTADRDFARFPKLRTRNPLAEPAPAG